MFVCVLRSMQALRPMCGCGYNRGVLTSQFCVLVQFEFLSDSGGDGMFASAGRDISSDYLKLLIIIIIFLGFPLLRDYYLFIGLQPELVVALLMGLGLMLSPCTIKIKISSLSKKYVSKFG